MGPVKLTANALAIDVGITHGAKNNNNTGLHGQVETESDRLASPRRHQEPANRMQNMWAVTV